MRHTLLTLFLWWSPALSWACGNAMVEAETQSASYQTESIIILGILILLVVTLSVAIWKRRRATHTSFS